MFLFDQEPSHFFLYRQKNQKARDYFPPPGLLAVKVSSRENASGPEYLY